MSHDYHEILPGYSPDQILHDGCGECEARGSAVHVAIGSMNLEHFARAWQRAKVWNVEGGIRVSSAESDVLRALWAVQVQLERLGVPLGTIPVEVSS